METLIAIFFIYPPRKAPQMVVLDTHTNDMEKAYHFACANGHDPRKMIKFRLIKGNKPE